IRLPTFFAFAISAPPFVLLIISHRARKIKGFLQKGAFLQFAHKKVAKKPCFKIFSIEFCALL
ncbi:MAG: hypothetical protein IKX92_07370, partial [Clostridia bacterium]|nr:hypothetical protein [Clostridia bacterium]